MQGLHRRLGSAPQPSHAGTKQAFTSSRNYMGQLRPGSLVHSGGSCAPRCPTLPHAAPSPAATMPTDLPPKDQVPISNNGNSAALDTSSSQANWTSNIWTRSWMPVAPDHMLHTEKPNKVTLLNRDLVVWYNQSSQSWQVVEDRCPHRFAPLSQGRIVDDHLVCSYHGWKFGPEGKCADIPQIPKGEAKDRACSLPKACATSYPSVVNDGLLFVWLDNSPEGLLLSSQKKPYTISDKSPPGWMMVENPNDYTYWLEQGFDPSHAPFLHHGIGGFEMKNAQEMEAWPSPDVSLEGGFTWHHGGYETRNVGLKATRRFIPPFANETRYDKPSASGSASSVGFTTIVVPVRPGICRSFFRFAALPSPSASSSNDSSSSSSTVQPQQQQKKSGGGLQSLFFSLARKLPHWVFTGLLLSDQDVIMMAQQEVRIRKTGLKPNDYALLASAADGGVAAVNRWLRMAGPPGPAWVQPLSTENLTEPTLEQLLARGPRHVDHCKICQQGFQQVTRACKVMTGLAAAAFAVTTALLAATVSHSLSNGLSAAAQQTGAPLLGAAALFVGLTVGMLKLWDFREDRFISGMKTWKRRGGLSLVPQME